MTTATSPTTASTTSTTTATATATTATTAQPPAPPSVHTRAVLTWIAVFAALTVVQLLVGPYVKGFPVLLRTLVITGIVVPAVAYSLVPNLLKARTAVLRRRA